jgi:hypothetical protein
VTREIEPTSDDRREAILADVEPRCSRCNKKLAELVARPWTITCVRCKSTNRGSAPTLQVDT